MKSYQHLTASRQKGLEMMQMFRKRSMDHPTHTIFQDKVREARGFYDGLTKYHWDEASLAKLQKRGQFPIVVNVLPSLVDNLIGFEIQNRRRTAYRSNSGIKKDAETTESLSHVGYNFQESEDVNVKNSEVYKGMAIDGVTWIGMYREDGRTIYEVMDSLNMRPDWDDTSPHFTRSRFLGRDIYMPRDEVKMKWPKAKDFIDVSDNWTESSSYSGELEDRQYGTSTSPANSSQSKGNILVCEMQYKVYQKAYRSIDKENHYFETFSEEDAEKLSASKNDIEEIDSQRIMRGLYVDDCLLEFAPLNPDFPNRADFNYIPGVLKKVFENNCPYGIIEQVKHIQRDLNVRYTKALYNVNSSRTTIEGQLPPGMTLENIREEVQKSDTVLFAPSGSKITVQSNAAIGREHIEIIDKSLMLMQRITGIQDEMLGIQTNATSAIAQQTRVVNSARNNVYGLDNLMFLKKREARLFLELLQSSDEQNILIKTVTEDEEKELWLNLHKVCEVKGKEVVINNIRNLPVSVYIEEVPDYQTIAEEESAMFRELLNHPMANVLLSSPDLLKAFSEKFRPRVADRLVETFKSSMASMNQPPQGQEQAVDPSQISAPMTGGGNPQELLAAMTQQ